MIFELGIGLFFTAALISAFVLSASLLEWRQISRTFQLATNNNLTAAEIERNRLSAPFIARVAGPALARLTRFSKRITPSSMIERLDVEIKRAGMQATWDASRVMAAKLAALGLLGATMFVVAMLIGLSPALAIVLAAAFAAIGYYAPEWWVRGRAGVRQQQIRRALPDALDLLSITVEAGLGFDAAVQRVAENSHGALSEELSRMLHELQIGRSRNDALRDMGDRSSVTELKSFCLAMIQADAYGISIAKMLQEQSKEARIARRQRAEEKAQKVQVKIVFPLLLCIFPSMFVVLLGPAMITIYESLFTR